MDNIETVYQAIAVLNGRDSSACGKASVWLGEFQKSIYSWTICDRILTEQKDSNACYFAAQTIRQKLLHSMKELPPSAHRSLHDSLLIHLSTFDCYPLEKNGVIITQLCLALADLYLQVPEWTDFIAEILDKFTKMPSDKTLVLLNLLKVFPEEIQSPHLRVGENRRRAVNAELARHTHAVLHFLSQVCVSNPNDTNLEKRVLNCLSSWLLNPLISTDELASSALLHSVFSLLQNADSPAELYDAACECVVSALYRAEETSAHNALAEALQSAAYAMADGFQMAVAREDFERLQSYARVFSELNETLLRNMISKPGVGLGDLKSLELLLLLAGYHDYSLVEMTFNVWYRLSEYLYERNDDHLSAVFKPYIERYIMALYKHCRFDCDHEGIPDENDDFAEFRLKVSDAIKDVVFIIGTDQCVQNMLSVLQAVSTGSWDESEAALFIISLVVHNVLPTDETVVPFLVHSVLQLPASSHPALLFTSVQLVGRLVDWIEENKQFQDCCMIWLLEKARNLLFVKAASEALENICGKCGGALAKHFDGIVAAIPLLEASPTKGQQMETAILSLLRACASLLNGLPGEEIANRLKILTSPQIERLTTLVSVSSANGRNGRNGEASSRHPFGASSSLAANNENTGDSWLRLSSDPVLWVDRIAAIFRQLQPWHDQLAHPKHSSNGGSGDSEVPWLETVSRIWPLVSAVCSNNETNVRIVEHCCRTIRFLIRSLGVQSIVFVEQLVHQMVDIYSRHQHSCFLYLASILVDEYGHMEHLRPGLLFMLNTLCDGSFKLLQSANGFRDHPDTIDDLFRLGIRFVQRAPSTFFSESVCESMFECGIVALDVDHVDANRSVTKFFIECVESLLCARKGECRDAGVERAEAIFAKFGERLVTCALRSAVFSVTGSLKRDMAEVIYNVGRLSKTKLSDWLSSALEKLPHDEGLNATSDQLRLFHQNVLEAKDRSQVYGQIRDLIRLYV